jgi:hypothetical protein
VTKPVEISFTMTDPDLYEMLMHSRSKLFGCSVGTLAKVLRVAIVFAFALMAFGLPTVLGMADDDPGKPAFQVGLLAAGVILAVFYPVYARWYTRRVSAAYQTLPLPMTLVIDDAGVEAQLDGQSGSTAWKLIERAVETDTHIFLYLNRLRGYIIPKAALTEAADLADLRQLIARHVASKA